jgi:GxxExxY protein
MIENDVSRMIIAAAIEVHRTLGGAGLLERVYEEALVFELMQRALQVERQKMFPLVYKGHSLSTALRVDLVVGGLVIVECKATPDDDPRFRAQALTYLRLSKLKLALVINFGKPLLRDGIHRVVNEL